MSKSKSTKEVESRILGAADDALKAAGFSRKGDSKLYSRPIKDGKQRIEFHFLKPVYADDRSICNVEINLEVQIPEVDAKVLELVKDPFNATKVTLAQSIGLVSPKKTLLRWSPKSDAELPKMAESITKALGDWAVPFLDDYKTTKDIVVGFEKDDPRLPCTPAFYLGVIAIYAINEQKEKARGVFVQHFNTDVRREKFGRVLENL
jgi:hypothetical protein